MQALTSRNLIQACMALLCASAFAAPTIDGRLEEAEWQSALRFDKFTVLNSNIPASPCTAMLVHDSQAVYIGFKVPFIDGKPPRAKAVRRDGQVFPDDSVEIMIAPGGSRDRYAHILVNSIGTINDAYADQGGFLRDEKWNGNIRAAGYVGPDFWSVEIRVPYSTLEMEGVDSPVWGFNFCHNTSAPNQSSSIAPNGVYHAAGAFVKVPGFNLDYSRYQLRITPPAIGVKASGDGKFFVDASLNVANLSGSERKVKIDFTLKGPDIASSEINCTIPAKGTAEVKLPTLVLGKSGDYTAAVGILDPSSRRIDVRRSFPVKVAYAPLSIVLESPHYRNAIFATQNIREIVCHVAVSADIGPIVAGISDSAGRVLQKKQIGKAGTVHFPADGLPEGSYVIFAEAGKYRAEHRLRKLSRKAGEVWRDRDGFWRIDGKRRFLIIEWADRHVPGSNVSTSTGAPTDCRLLSPDMIYSMFRRIVTLRDPTLSPKEEKLIRDTVTKGRDNANLFAWYLEDEPECEGASSAALARAAETAREADPWHPLVISNDSVSGFYDYFDSGEINGFHPYPNPEKGNPRSGFGRIAATMDALTEFNAGHRNPQSIIYLQQGFNYGDWGSMNSRIPTFDEIRTQFLMTAVMGGRGILFYNRTTEHYPELWIGMPETGREFAALQDVLALDDQPGGLKSGKLRTMIKRNGGDLWIFAASVSPGEFTHEFNFPELGGRKLQVWREGREITARNGRFSDRFKNFDVHVYTTSPDRCGLRNVAEVEAEIAAANAKRRKPGNLAFQMFEHDSLKLKASSNFWLNQRADNTLWHVTDGVNLGDKSDERTFFKTQTGAVLPDWIEIEFPKPVTVGRIMVFPMMNSIGACEAQVWSGGVWKTAASVSNASGPQIEFKFTPVTTDRMRVLVTERRGKNTMIAEIEVYGK